MPFAKARTTPTTYSHSHSHPLVSTVLKGIQAVSSTVVAGITFYFLRELRRDGYSLPWTFILLLAVSLLTLLFLTLSLFPFPFPFPRLHTRRPRPSSTLPPHRLVLALHLTLALLWTVSFALLAWWTSPVLNSSCAAKESWDTDTGVGICRLYKALFSFALFGTVGAWGSVGLRVWVSGGRRKGRGAFVGLLQQQEDDEGVWDADVGVRVRVGGGEMGTGRERMGYAVPEGQWSYSDTGYGGAGEAVGRRSAEGRM